MNSDSSPALDGQTTNGTGYRSPEGPYSDRYPDEQWRVSGMPVLRNRNILQTGDEHWKLANKRRHKTD